LHPGLASLKDWYAEGSFLPLHAVASPYRDRSHFDGQDLLETGAARLDGPRDGWLNRTLGLIGATDRRFGIAFAEDIPLVLRGTAPVLSTAARTIGSLGAAVLAAGALLNVTTATMSKAYQQAAEADRSVVVLAWQAAQDVMDALLVTGALLLPAAVVLFGIALRRGLSPVLGWGAVVVGTAGTAAVVVVVATSSPSALVAVSILAALTFHLVAGVRWLRMSHS
ncbi:MAG: hypothetical protein L0H84_23520, partial [Pseudonocardia sp.]|nr:hypothetical protein [Pseudonocardia sp.]